MENMWNLKKTLVVGISQQLYIEKALSIHFQGEGKKERKEKSANPKLKHQPYTPLDTYIHVHTPEHKSWKGNEATLEQVDFQNAVPLCSTTGQEDGCTQSPGGSGWLLGS